MTATSNQTSTDFYIVSIETFTTLLEMLDQLLEGAGRYVADKGRKESDLTSGRLAPDMFPLTLQVKLACRWAQDAADRLQGQGPEINLSGGTSWPDIPIGEDSTLTQMQSGVRQTIDKLCKADRKEIEKGRGRQIQVVLEGGLLFQADGLHFITRWILPNFYFHVVTAFDILRHLGMPIGIKDFMPYIGPFISRVSREPAAEDA